MAVRRQIGRGAKRAGFTLLELMIAVGVLLVAVLGTFSTQFTSNNLLRQTRETETATVDLQAAMEQIMIEALDDLALPASPYPANAAIAAYEGLHLANQRIVATYPNYVAGAPLPDPLDIVLVQTWQDFRGRPRTTTLACRKTR